MLDLTFEQFFNAEFRLYGGNPVVRRFGLSTVVADPSVLTPDVSPDGLWHMFAHTLFGVYEFLSDDGIRFGRGRRILSRAMRPDIKCVDGLYYLFYERVQPLPVKALAASGRGWRSEIYVAVSRDLKKYSAPKKVLGYDMPYERAVGGKGHSLSNPFLLETDNGFSLYYSAGLTYLKDCGFSEPTYIFRAAGSRPDGAFVKSYEPIIVPDAKSELFNLCCGCLKVYRLKDGYIGLQNGIFKENGASKSAIQLLRSENGKDFEFVRTLLAPSEECGGWMKQYVYSSCLTSYGGVLRLYFNARDKSNPISGRENIGFAEASIPT